MNEHIFTLEMTSISLNRAKALAAFMTDYFSEVDPEPNLLLCRYEQYGELNHAIHDILCREVKAIDELVEAYYKAWRGQAEKRTRTQAHCKREACQRKRKRASGSHVFPLASL